MLTRTLPGAAPLKTLKASRFWAPVSNMHTVNLITAAAGMRWYLAPPVGWRASGMPIKVETRVLIRASCRVSVRARVLISLRGENCNCKVPI